MNEHINVDPGCYGRRWVAYLDLLGFRKLVCTETWVNIFSVYTQAIEHFMRESGVDEPTIEKVWFSDTFILLSPDDTALSFCAIESAARWFVDSLVSRGIPIRGAISCADLYADKKNRLLFGKALLEAHDYGENQNWIGLVLTPSSVEQMAVIGLPADQRLDYRYWTIPRKKPDEALEKTLPACVIGGSILGYNHCLDELRKMKIRFEGTDYITKYENTISFIEAMRCPLPPNKI